jgi:hypothetical protein
MPSRLPDRLGCVSARVDLTVQLHGKAHGLQMQSGGFRYIRSLGVATRFLRHDLGVRKQSSVAVAPQELIGAELMPADHGCDATRWANSMRG